MDGRNRPGSKTAPLLRLDRVSKTYHVGDMDVQALRGVSLSVARGELVAIMGASGSGKSTLMYILGCLDRPTSGQYLLEGTDVGTLDEPDLARLRSERLGFVFQSFNLLNRTSAIENVALPLFYLAAGPADRIGRLARARSALELLKLPNREASTPGQLSGGQQQRVAIARALINSPSLLLADEPTGNLDTHTSHDIMQTLVALNRQRGVTVVIVTHELDIAAYADRVITMRDGEIVSDQQKDGRDASRNAVGDEGDPLASFRANDSAPHPARFAGGSAWAFGMMIIAAAMQAINRNKMRSALTMLGVFIGVAALIAMVAVGQGANEAVRKQIESLGTNLLVIIPGATTSSGVRAGFGSASTLTVRDVEAIRREDPAVADVGYLNRQIGQVQYANQNWSTNIQGVSTNNPSITNWQVVAGREITDDDQRSAALVGLIGQTVYHQLFGADENPVGATVLVKSSPVRIVGLLGSKGQTAFGQDQDDVIMIPFTTAEGKVLGSAAPAQLAAKNVALYPAAPNPFGLQLRLTGYVNSINVQAISSDQVENAVQQVTETLQRRHGIKAGDPNDFAVRNLSQIADAAEGSSQVMALLLATVASISLLVGGIGIMNILLVSVTERTREIGLRMAIGARRLHILTQFLAEAVLLSVTGGIIGIVIGVVASQILAVAAHWPVEVSPAAIAGGFLFSAAVGIFFGFYPAQKAARLDPIEALRYE